MDDELDMNEIRRPCETGSRPGAMEDHDSQPSQRRRHLMMIMMLARHRTYHVSRECAILKTTGNENDYRKAKNRVDYEHQKMDGNEI